MAWRGLSTIAPSLLSHSDEKATSSSPLIDLTMSESSIDRVKATPSVDGEENHWLLDESEVRFWSSDDTVVDSSHHRDDDILLSSFIRSPSPDMTVRSSDQSQPAFDGHRSKNPFGTSIPTSSSGNPPIRHSQAKDELLDACKAPRQKLRIRLRVEPPKPKVTLRISAPKKSQSDKRRRQPKKSMARSSQQQKKRSARR